ncbi:uncharacterized protein LY79DRAFT_570891 [Colletotrichum navitas]|uniref:Uncharacterized protein n=1 Tax=Colletotrichum navitas TaxID=681940 RepID=A0AAD8PM76_9PEZI|nr:uncharacterized protein LY79DRAFT_570891 [Colletotrichum navitas]KAK1569905.1 hypothetical protein LY79DRAFT_570891 [Colletotrichum navitas]
MYLFSLSMARGLQRRHHAVHGRDSRALVERRCKGPQDVHAVLVRPVVEDPAEELHLGAPGGLRVEERVRQELDGEVGDFRRRGNCLREALLAVSSSIESTMFSLFGSVPVILTHLHEKSQMREPARSSRRRSETPSRLSIMFMAVCARPALAGSRSRTLNHVVGFSSAPCRAACRTLAAASAGSSARGWRASASAMNRTCSPLSGVRRPSTHFRRWNLLPTAGLPSSA